MKSILQNSQMKRIIVIIIILGTLSSCSTYKATVRQHEDLDYGVMKVTPDWEYIDHKGSKKLIRGIGLISGGIYGYTNETTVGGETYTGFENAAPWGIIGYIGGAIITSVIFQKEDPDKTIFNISQSDKWLNEFNQSTGNNYLLNSKNLDNTLLLIPRSNLEALRYEYKLLEEDLKKPLPTTDFQTLQSWEIKLTKEFSYLPADELNNLKNLITKSKEKLAGRELKEYAKEIEQLANEEESLATIERLHRNSQEMYYAASSDAQIDYKNTTQEKINKILTIIVSDEQNKLSAYGNELVDLETINSSIPAIDKKFSDYKGNSDVDNYYTLLNSKVSNLLSINRTKIETKINGLNELKQLDGFKNKYISNVSNDLLEVQEANQLLQKREKDIIEYNNKVRQNAFVSASKSDFNTDGLYNAELFDNIYRGHFENIEIGREDVFFLGVMEQYLRAYGEQCPNYLPDDKVRIMELVCSEYLITEDFYTGIEKSRECIDWEWDWTGLYARPDLYNAKLELERNNEGNELRNWIEMLSDDNYMGNSVNLYHKAQGLIMDMARIFKLNPCDSKALRRFEENLKLFALNKPAIRMQEDGIYETVKKYGGPTGPQYFAKLIDDLVVDQAKTWMINRYIRGSISGVSVLSTDKKGRPVIIKANYRFSGLVGSEGWVKIVFEDGLPNSIYFWDFPSNGKTPNSSIVVSYAQGKYSK